MGPSLLINLELENWTVGVLWQIWKNLNLKGRSAFKWFPGDWGVNVNPCKFRQRSVLDRKCNPGMKLWSFESFPSGLFVLLFFLCPDFYLHDLFCRVLVCFVDLTFRD